MVWILFFCAVAKEIQRLFPVIYEKPPIEKGAKPTNIGAIKTKTIENFYWEIVAIKVAELGIFNIGNVAPLEIVMNKRAYDVLKVYNLKLTNL